MHIVQTKVHHNHLINAIRTRQSLLIETVPVGGYRRMPHVSPFNESIHLLTQLE